MASNSTDSVIANQGSLSPWLCCAHRPGTSANPSQLTGAASEWLPATVPCTVASTLAANKRWSFEHPPDIDADDWWFATSFQAKTGGGQHPTRLHLDGLATLAEVWLNGELLLKTDNMFRSHCVDVSSRLRLENELIIGFRSITEDLKAKRPRPRWKTNLVNNQQLRWHRTTLQGRIPGWSPPAPAIGPWRGVRLETGQITPHSLTVRPQLEGTVGVVTLEGHLLSAVPIQRASLRVGSHVETLHLEREVDGYSVQGKLQVANARPWSPHTHGQPVLYDCELILESGDVRYRIACDPLGFRKVEVTTADGFQVLVNGQPVYCRGACWTVSDILTLSGTEEQLRHDLTLARDAGVNMLRVGGTMVYESDSFYRLCDELGILVWQDFMFANMDYPVDDESFRHNLVAEVSEQVRRLAKHACVAVYCGNSEIEQQAAMLGMPREIWTNSWFAQELPELCERFHPGAGYVPSTPTGGALPFQPNTGLTHYYGVGAYLRPTSDIRRSDVKFTPECLGFSNIPEASTIEAITQGGHAVMHDARWKRRVPRDIGAGWDFEDVRDHYLKETFHVDPVQLRSWDTPKYLQLSRLVSGEMMQQAFSEWRSSHSHNHGGLVWFYKDLWPAAGWGILDSTGTPKAAYYFLKRVWNSRQLVVTDEGLNGLHLHLINETSEACNGTVEVQLLKEPNVVVARQELAVRLEGASQRTFSADEILGGFYDVSYAYRFGPPHHDVAIVTWFDSERRVIGEAFHFIRRSVPALDRAVTLQTTGDVVGDNRYQITLQSDRLLQGVTVNAKGYLPDDNYFHLPPGRTKTVTFRATSAQAPSFKALVEAINMESSHVVSARPKSI
jgi:beta-mannosidase